jgi:hypothetical protein
MVTLRNSSAVAVRDISNLSKPVTRCLIVSAPGFLRFRDSTHISYLVQSEDGSSSAMYLVDLQTRKASLLLGIRASQGLEDYAWSPDGSTLIYAKGSGIALEIHQLKAGRDRLLASVPAIPAVGCEYDPCPDWDLRLLYSPDGTRISLVYYIAKSVFRIWTSDGKLLKADDSQLTSMSVWSGNGMYFASAKGVQVWRAGVTSNFLPAVGWIRPNDSSLGAIVYETRDTIGWTHIYVVDPTTGRTRDVKVARSEPIFLTSSTLWYQGQRACVPADNCPPRVSVVPSGKTYIYDLQTGTEAESVITSVLDVWPHGA